MELLKVKGITTDLTNPYFPLATFRKCFFSPFSRFNDGKISHKYCNKRITTFDNANVQSHDQEKNKLNSTINVNNGAQTLAHD